jgi:hypothetical protein
MAKFERGKYQSNGGDIHPIRISEDRYAAAGTPPAGDVNSSIRVKISKNNTEFGIRPRGLRLARELGTDPDTFTKYTFLPVLTQTAWEGFSENEEVEIDGVTWTVVSKVPEDF